MDDLTRLDAVQALIARPCPFDGWRTHHVTQAGDPDRATSVLLPLLTRWAQRRAVDREVDSTARRVAA